MNNSIKSNKRYQTLSTSLDKSIKALGSSVTPTVGTTDNGRKNIGNVRHFLSKKFNVQNGHDREPIQSSAKLYTSNKT